MKLERPVLLYSLSLMYLPEVPNRLNSKASGLKFLYCPSIHSELELLLTPLDFHFEIKLRN